MNIKVNTYMNPSLYAARLYEREPSGCDNSKSEAKPEIVKDTVSISVGGQQFTAERTASDSEIGSARITSDLDSFRSAVKSMNEPLTVNWEATVDPFGTFRGLATTESYMKQLQDPSASKNHTDMQRVADEYANSKIALLIEKKQAMLASEGAKSYSDEYAEYKTAYDAYHSQNAESLLSMMTGDTKKAYTIYKNIIDGASISIEDEEFLMLHNHTMYIGAKSEYIRKSEA